MLDLIPVAGVSFTPQHSALAQILGHHVVCKAAGPGTVAPDAGTLIQVHTKFVLGASGVVPNPTPKQRTTPMALNTVVMMSLAPFFGVLRAATPSRRTASHLEAACPQVSCTLAAAEKETPWGSLARAALQIALARGHGSCAVPGCMNPNHFNAPVDELLYACITLLDPISVGDPEAWTEALMFPPAPLPRDVEETKVPSALLTTLKKKLRIQDPVPVGEAHLSGSGFTSALLMLGPGKVEGSSLTQAKWVRATATCPAAVPMALISDFEVVWGLLLGITDRE